MSLADVLRDAAAAAGVAGVDANGDAATTEWSVAGRPFAAATPDDAEFRLRPAIAQAALGTPDTAPSPRGPDWIRFRPDDLDRFAIDRAAAWFGIAARHAQEGGGFDQVSGRASSRTPLPTPPRRP